MRKLRVASVALLVVASTGLVFGSMGFSSVAADRGVSVAVVDDDNALVGYDTANQTVTGDEGVELVTVTNKLSSSASVTDVSVAPPNDESEVEVRDIQTPGSIPTGESRTVDAAVDCESGAAETLTVSVTVEADGVTAEISGDTATRSFEVACEDVEAHDRGVRFSGNGNVHFDGWSQDTLNVTYWTETNDGFEQHGPVDVDSSQKLKKSVSGGTTSVIAVYVDEANKTYFHPNFDTNTGEMGNPGQGNENTTTKNGERSPNDF